MSSGCRSTDNRSVLNRAASIMEAFTGTHRVLSLMELSRRTNLPRSTVYRFADQLLDLGWLERELDGYRVGIRLFEVGALAERRNRLRDKALPHLHDLTARTGMVANLGILEQHEVLYLESVPLRGLELAVRSGERMPASCTALGKALLAFSTGNEVEDVAAAGLPRLTRTSIVTVTDLAAELDRVRAAGVAFDQEETTAGIACAAAPLRSSGRAIGALSVTGPAGVADLRLAGAAVRRAADAVWADLFPRIRCAS